MKKFLIVFLSVFVIIIGCSDVDVENAEKNARYKRIENQENLIKRELLLEDFDALYEYVKTYYRGPEAINNQGYFDDNFELYKGEISSDMSIKAFYGLASDYLSTLDSGDVYLDHLSSEDELYLPFSIKFEDGWRIDESYLDSDTYEAYEILQINGISVEELEEKLFPIASLKYQMDHLEMLEDYYTFATSFNVVYGSYEEIVVMAMKDGKVEELTFKPLTYDVFGLICRDEAYYSQQNTFRVINEEELLIRIGSFDGVDFQREINEIFKQVKDANVDTLVVDFRGTSGGNAEAGLYLLEHLVAEEIKWIESVSRESTSDYTFDGHLQVLVGYQTSGIATLISEYIQSNDLGLVIGDEPNGYNCYYEKQIVKVLPHTDLHVHMGTKLIMLEESVMLKGLEPDLNYTLSEDNILSYMANE